MKKYLIIPLIIATFVAPSCSHKPKKPHLKEHITKKEHRAVNHLTPLDNGQYYYQNNDFWYYMWLTDSGKISSVERSMYSPVQMGYSIRVGAPILERVANGEPKVNEETEQEGQIEQEDAQNDAQVEAENTAIDAENASAIEAFENEGGNINDPDSGTESDSSPGTDSSSDGGSSDSGGGND